MTIALAEFLIDQKLRSLVDKVDAGEELTDREFKLVLETYQTQLKAGHTEKVYELTDYSEAQLIEMLEKIDDNNNENNIKQIDHKENKTSTKTKSRTKTKSPEGDH